MHLHNKISVFNVFLGKNGNLWFYEAIFISISIAYVANPSQLSVQHHFNSRRLLIDRDYDICFKGIDVGPKAKTQNPLQFSCFISIPKNLLWCFTLFSVGRKEICRHLLWHQNSHGKKSEPMNQKNIIFIILPYLREQIAWLLCYVLGRVLLTKLGLI